MSHEDTHSYFSSPSHDSRPVFKTLRPKEHDSSSDPHPFWDVFKFAFVALLIVLPIRAFVAQPFIVSGDSMIPTLLDKEYLIVDQISYTLGDISRGDVIVFKYPGDTTRFFIKRVIGLPGETVAYQEKQVVIFNDRHPDGLVLSEPYINPMSRGFTTLTLDTDEYFVMGDNRDESSDSRFWGPLPKNLIVGRAFIRIFPPGRATFLPGDGRSLYEF